MRKASIVMLFIIGTLFSGCSFKSKVEHHKKTIKYFTPSVLALALSDYINNRAADDETFKFSKRDDIEFIKIHNEEEKVIIEVIFVSESEKNKVLKKIYKPICRTAAVRASLEHGLIYNFNIKMKNRTDSLMVSVDNKKCIELGF